MPTDSEIQAQLDAALAQAKKSADEIRALKSTQVAALALVNAALVQVQSALASEQQAHQAADARIAALEAQLAQQPAVNPVTAAKVAEVKAQMQINDELIPDLTTPPPVDPPPPPTDDAAILAEVTDSSVAGMSKRLGPAGNPATVFPDVWTRPQVPTHDFGFEGSPMFGTYSEGLSITAPPTVPPAAKPKFDYGSTELEIAAVDDQPLVVNPDNPSALNSDGGPGPQGVGLYRLRIEEHAEGVVALAPVIPWNDPDVIPDKSAVVGHTASYGMGNKLGRFIQVVRGRINRYDGGFALADGVRGGGAYIGTVPTKTAWSAWSGIMLPVNLVPLCLGISSQNEFLVVGAHDKNTRTGKLVYIVNWGSQTVDGKPPFPSDFNEPYPGLLQSGVITGQKIIGIADLPIKWPTSVSIATSRNQGSNRIEGENGDAAYLSNWDLSTAAKRAAFLAKNGGWIAAWGKIVVAGKYEDKVVQLDATALFQGYRDQYFTTDANYAASRPHLDNAWYNVYDVGNAAAWPYMLPAWVPTVTRVIDVVRPTVAWMLETNDGAFVIGKEDGTLLWFKDSGAPDGTLQLGAGITSIKDDKYQDGVRNGALIVVSRAARTVYGVRGKQVARTIQDAKLVDPIDAGTADTHGIEDRSVWVLGFNDKKVIHYRNSKLVLATQGGAVFGTGPDVAAGTEGLEVVGWKDLPGHPVSGADSNVN